MRNLRLLCLAILLSSCAIPIYPWDVAFLRGRWEGMYVLRNMHYESVLTIYNDTVPLKGSLSINFSPGKPLNEYWFYNGRIDPQGRLIIQLPERMYLELTLEKERGGLKLEGNLYRGELPGLIGLLKTTELPE